MCTENQCVTVKVPGFWNANIFVDLNILIDCVPTQLCTSPSSTPTPYLFSAALRNDQQLYPVSICLVISLQSHLMERSVVVVLGRYSVQHGHNCTMNPIMRWTILNTIFDINLSIIATATTAQKWMYTTHMLVIYLSVFPVEFQASVHVSDIPAWPNSCISPTRFWLSPFILTVLKKPLCTLKTKNQGHEERPNVVSGHVKKGKTVTYAFSRELRFVGSKHNTFTSSLTRSVLKRAWVNAHHSISMLKWEK